MIFHKLFRHPASDRALLRFRPAGNSAGTNRCACLLFGI